MQIIAKTAFFDLEEKKQRKEGDRWNADKERCEFLVGIDYAEYAPEKKAPELRKQDEAEEKE